MRKTVGATISINNFMHGIISLNDAKVVNAMNMVHCLIILIYLNTLVMMLI